MKPGIYPKLSMAEYLAIPALSRSIISSINDRCERAAWFDSWLNPNRVRNTSEQMDCGTIAHGILLEGTTDGVAVINPEDHPAEKTGNIPDGWTNKSIRAARDDARAAGKIPVLVGDMLEIMSIVGAARAFIESLRTTEPAIWQLFQPDGGESELTMVWNDGGTPCRLRADRISHDRALIVDYKTSGISVEPDRWGRTQLVSMGYYVSASWYRRGVEALFGVTPAYVFLCQETEPPYLCSLIGVEPQGFALGGEKIEAGLATWRRCVASNDWPAYPNRVCYPSIPAWEYARWQEKQEADAQGIPYDVSKLFPKKEITL